MKGNAYLRWMWGVVAAVLIFVVLGARIEGPRDVLSLSAAESRGLIEEHRSNKQFVILDVRTPLEFAHGHIDRAVLLDFNAPGFEQALQSLDKEKTYLIYCRSGNRSAKAITIASGMGFSKLYHMEKGILEWQSLGFPLVR